MIFELNKLYGSIAVKVRMHCLRIIHLLQKDSIKNVNSTGKSARSFSAVQCKQSSLCPSLFEFQLPGLSISLRPNSDQIAILMPLVIGSQLDVRIAEPLTLKFEVKKVS